MSICEKRVFKSKTFTTEQVIAMAEYVELKNNFFFHQELHHKEILHYLEDMPQIYETDLVLLMKNSAVTF